MKWIKTALVMLALGLSFSALALEDEDEMAFKDGLMEGKVAVVKKYIEADPKLVNENSLVGPPLQMAANANQIKVAEYLVSKGADLNYIHPNAHHTAFMLAALNGSKEMATYLAKAGADVNVKLKGDVSLIRYFRDEGIPDWVELLTKLGVKDDGCEGKCF